MAGKLLGGVFNNDGEPCATIVVQNNAIRTESYIRTERSVVAIDKITRIKCFDISPEFPLKSFLIWLLIGLCTIWILIGIIPIIIAGYLAYQYNKNKGTYQLAIELTSGANVTLKSQDMMFLDTAMNVLFDAVQNGTGNRVINIDARSRIVNTGIYNPNGVINGNANVGSR